METDTDRNDGTRVQTLKASHRGHGTGTDRRRKHVTEAIRQTDTGSHAQGRTSDCLHVRAPGVSWWVTDKPKGHVTEPTYIPLFVCCGDVSVGRGGGVGVVSEIRTTRSDLVTPRPFVVIANVVRDGLVEWVARGGRGRGFWLVVRLSGGGEGVGAKGRILHRENVIR